MSFLAISGIAGHEQHMVRDEALMLDFQGGSREAFEELFALTRTTVIPLRGTVSGFTNNHRETATWET